VTDFLCDALGYDKYSDLTTEYVVRGQYADYGIRIDGNLLAFIEVKRVGTNLNKSHLRQVEMYAVNEGVEWVILTNGTIWQVYHIGNTTPIQVDLALEVDLLTKGKRTQKIEELTYLSRESMVKRRMDELWQATKATAPESLGKIVLSDSVVSAIRNQLRRETGHRITNEEVADLLKTTVLRAEVI
jgi:predicted type IV restriction endonuclease